MANEEQLSILKQGVKVWNEWREKNSDTEIDLQGAQLSGVDLGGANLTKANLNGANFIAADLSGANLSWAYLGWVDLSRADLNSADLTGVNLDWADLNVTNLARAKLISAKLYATNLTRANLTEADLRGTYLEEDDLTEAKFTNATMVANVLVDVDLTNIVGLADIYHGGPSTIGTNTLVKAKGKIPDIFLRGCGLSDWEIESAKLYNPNLSNDEIVKIQYRIYELRATQAIQLSPLFISYSHEDSEFVNRIDHSLTNNGIRFWRDIHDMKAGRMEKQIDQAIHQNPTVLLVLSKDSLESDWVEHEVRTARRLEKEMKRDVLCPVALDDSWKSSRWPARVMEQIKEYNILDFSDWQTESTFERTFNKLVDGLGLFYK